jgi:drug/metabolite transporter (DMT)-like permease
VLSKVVLAHLLPLSLLVIQLIASLTILWPLLWLQRTTILGNKRLLSLGLLGWLNPGISYTLSLIGLSLTTVSMSALLWAMEPLLIVGLAWLLLRDRLTPGFLLVSGLAAGGVVLAIGTDLSHPGQFVGNALILSGVLCCALYTVLARRLSDGSSPLLAVTLQESLALVWALLIWPVELSRLSVEAIRQIPAETWILAVVSGLVYYGLAFWFYLNGLRHVSASEAGLFINLVPLVALGGAYGLLGETLLPIQWVGCGLVLVAVLCFSLQLRPSRGVGAD